MKELYIFLYTYWNTVMTYKGSSAPYDIFNLFCSTQKKPIDKNKIPEIIQCLKYFVESPIEDTTKRKIIYQTVILEEKENVRR